MVILFFKRLLKSLYVEIHDILSLTRLQKKYSNCQFYSGSKIYNSEFGNFNVVFNDVLMESCVLGDHTYVQKKATIFNADIGRFCSIASGVSIGPGIHKIDGVSTHPVFYLHNTPLAKEFCDKDLFVSSKRTSVGHDVWIGEKAIVLDGVTIGTGAIVAAGSVVTKDVEPYSIVGGLPAKHIKYRFDEKEIEALLKSEWWNYSEEWLLNNYKLFSSPQIFINNLTN